MTALRDPEELIEEKKNVNKNENSIDFGDITMAIDQAAF